MPQEAGRWREVGQLVDGVGVVGTGTVPATPSQPPFHVLVVALKALLVLFAGDVLGLGQDLGQRRWVAGGLVRRHPPRPHPSAADGPAEERRGILIQGFDLASVFVQ